MPTAPLLMVRLYRPRQSVLILLVVLMQLYNIQYNYTCNDFCFRRRSSVGDRVGCGLSVCVRNSRCYFVLNRRNSTTKAEEERLLPDIVEDSIPTARSHERLVVRFTRRHSVAQPIRRIVT